MDNFHEIHLWSKVYREEALERARIRGLLGQAKGAERGHVVLFRTKREAGTSEKQLLPTVRRGL